MVEKRDFWTSVEIGVLVVPLLAIILICAMAVTKSLAPLLLMFPIAGFIGGYLFKEGIRGGIKVGFTVGICFAVFCLLLFLLWKPSMTLPLFLDAITSSHFLTFLTLLLSITFYISFSGAIGG